MATAAKVRQRRVSRARWGDAVPDGFARISLGIEDTDDLLADIERALLTLR
ncbi:hypothetical protein MAHJHV54_47920 [Mycobacterium avium subsp. hominissuis]